MTALKPRTPSLAALDITIRRIDHPETDHLCFWVVSHIAQRGATLTYSPAWLNDGTATTRTVELLKRADPHIRPWAYTDPPAINPTTWRLLPRPIAHLADILDRKYTP